MTPGLQKSKTSNGLAAGSSQPPAGHKIKRKLAPRDLPIILRGADKKLIAGIKLERVDLVGGTLSLTGWCLGSSKLALMQSGTEVAAEIRRLPRRDVLDKHPIATDFEPGFLLTTASLDATPYFLRWYLALADKVRPIDFLIEAPNHPTSNDLAPPLLSDHTRNELLDAANLILEPPTSGDLREIIIRHKIFDEDWYREKNRSLIPVGQTPLQHFIEYGYFNNLAPNRYFQAETYQGSPSDQNVIGIYIKNIVTDNKHSHFDGGFSNLTQNERSIHDQALSLGLFNGDWYFHTNQDVYISSSYHPWVHYIKFGWKEGRDPSPAFSNAQYLTSYQNREKLQGDPLTHFIVTGRKNGLQYWPAHNQKHKQYATPRSRVLFIKSPSDPYTMIYRADAIENHIASKNPKGSKTVFSFFSNNIDTSTLVHELKAIILVRSHLTPDVICILNRAKHFRIPIIFDIDDYVWDLSKKNKLRSILYKDKESANHLADSMEKWRAAILRSDAISVSTWPLKKLAAGFDKPVIVIPNSVPRQLQNLGRAFERKLRKTAGSKPGIVEIGYFSGTATHQHDTMECLDALEQVMAERGNAHLRLVGHVDDVLARLSEYSSRITVLPLLPYRAMLSELSRCDIVIAPLETRNLFCDCKSELKIFEASLFSLPVICSPSATYASTITDGVNGYLAGSETEWREKLLSLIDSRETRIRFGSELHANVLPRFDTNTVVEVFNDFVTHIGAEIANNVPRSQEVGCLPGKSKQQPTISLVSILHNKSKELPDFLRSIQMQEFSGPAEIILVDDLSTDNSLAIAQSWSKYLGFSEVNDWITVKLLTNDKNQGNCISRNRGIEAATADIVVVVDADCILSSNLFQSHVNAHLSGAGDVVIGYRGIETNGAQPVHLCSRLEAASGRAAIGARNQDDFLLSDFVNVVTRNMSFNKKVHQILFDEEFSYTRSPRSGFGWEDVEFGFRLFQAEARIVFLDECFTLHVTHAYEGDEKEKAKRSALNFIRLLKKHPQILQLNPGWAKTTSDKIQAWLKRTDNGSEYESKFRTIKKKLNGGNRKNILLKSKSSALRILSHKWHTPHQYELCKTQNEFVYAVSDPSKAEKNWDYDFRPRPGNVKFVAISDIDCRDYDLILGHFDENVFHPERSNNVLHPSWGSEFKNLLELRDRLPMVAICHGTPQFQGQYDILYDKADLGDVIESSRAEMVSSLGNTHVILNSYQAQSEWRFWSSSVIWHGFQPSEFYPISKSRHIITMGSEKIRQRPIYNGYFLFKKCMEILDPEELNLDIGTLEIKNSNIRIARTAHLQMWARAKFSRYREELARTSFYMNFTQRSPMPRTRGEGMMSGVVPVTTANHDAALFIKHGDNGFLFDSADEFKEVIRFVDRHPAKWEAWSRSARDTAIQEFHIDRYLREWEEIFRDIAR